MHCSILCCVFGIGMDARADSNQALKLWTGKLSKHGRVNSAADGEPLVRHRHNDAPCANKAGRLVQARCKNSRRVVDSDLIATIGLAG